MTACAGLSYSIIIGDSFASVAKLAGAPAILTSSNAWIMLLSVFVLLPLSLMRDLSSLAIGSVIGTGGTCYTALFIFKRLLDKSYAAGGQYFSAIPAAVQPSFFAPTVAKPLLNSGMFVLLSMLSSAFLVCARRICTPHPASPHLCMHLRSASALHIYAPHPGAL